MIRRLALCGILMIQFAALGADGAVKSKEVTLRWEKVEKTKGYEIELFRDDKLVKKASSRDESVKFLIEPGYYQYSLRVIDIFDRPGLWSDRIPLAVLPPPPLPEVPRDGEEVVSSKVAAQLEFSWVAPPKGIRTQVLVKRNGHEVFSQIVSGSKAKLGPFGEGKFSWSLKAILGDRDQYSTPSSENFDFRVERGLLAAPKLLAPRGMAVVTESSPGQVFEWEKVKGARAYQFTIRSIDSGRQREALVTSPQYFLPKVPLGRYEWKVTALSFIPGESASSESERVVFSHHLDFAPGIDLWLGAGMGDTKYRVENARTYTHASTSTSTRDLYAGFDVWFHPKFSFSVLANLHEQKAYSSDNKTTFNAHVLSKFRSQIMKGSGLSYQIGLGPESRQESELIMQYGSRVETVNLLGAGSRGGLLYESGLKNRYALNLSYFYPFLLSGPPKGSSLVGPKNFQNFSTQLKYQRQIIRAWWGLGLGYVSRGVEFRTSGSASHATISNRGYLMLLDVTIPVYSGK